MRIAWWICLCAALGLVGLATLSHIFPLEMRREARPGVAVEQLNIARGHLAYLKIEGDKAAVSDILSFLQPPRRSARETRSHRRSVSQPKANASQPYFRFVWKYDSGVPLLGTKTQIDIALWGIPLLLLPMILVPRSFRWAKRRYRVCYNRCTRCGYDLTGNQTCICPECGCATEAGNGRLHDGTVT